jgi:1,4-dihydroxy-2-naphthoate octaprenyltransferase
MANERPNAARIWISAARPRTLPAAIAPVLVGSALALRNQTFAAAPAAACLAFGLLVQIGTNFANDYCDFLKGADSAARVGPRRAVAAGWVAPSAMRAAALATFAAAFLVGLSLLGRGGWPLLVVGVASIASGLAYTAGPFPLAYVGLGDVFVFFFFGPVAVAATVYVQSGRIDADALLASIPIGLLAANILLVNNYRDSETDRKARKRTLVVRFGRRFARIQYAVCLAVALLVPVLFWARGFGPWILLPVLLVPLGWRQADRLRQAVHPAQLITLLGQTGMFLAVYAVLFAVGIAFAD